MAKVFGETGLPWNADATDTCKKMLGNNKDNGCYAVN